MTKSVYGLVYQDPVRGPVVFYVGCTNDVARRTQEHARNPFNTNHAEYNTYKYKFCRDLTELGYPYYLEVLSGEEDITDEADEYSWILKFARYNEDNAIAFYDHMPLTNMKAGDFLEEMLRDRNVHTAGQIRTFVERKRAARVASYQRDNHNTSVFNAEGKRILAQANAWRDEQAKARQEKQIKKSTRDAKKKQEYDTWLEQQRAIFEQERK